MRTHAGICENAILRTIGIGLLKAGIDSHETVNVTVRPNAEAALHAEDEEEEEECIQESRTIKGKKNVATPSKEEYEEHMRT